MRIGVVGVGALGTEVTLRMAQDPVLLSTVDTVLLIDPDCLEAGNIPLSQLFGAAVREHGEALLGRYKAEVAAYLLNEIHRAARPERLWSPHCVEFADVSWQHLRPLDLIVSCTDSALARVEVAFAARSLGIPVLDGGVLGGAAQGGRVTRFAPAVESACFLCGLGEERRAELLTFASSTSLPCAVMTDVAMGSDPVASAPLQQTADAMVRELRLFIVMGRGATSLQSSSGSWTTLLHSRGPGSWQSEHVQLRQSSSCPWHGTMELPLVTVNPDQTFGAALAQVHTASVARLQFAWPLCTFAVCTRCGARDERPRRVSLVRRRGVCEACGTPHTLAPLRTVASVGQKDAMAEMTPLHLGWADQQLLQVRPSLVLQ